MISPGLTGRWQAGAALRGGLHLSVWSMVYVCVRVCMCVCVHDSGASKLALHCVEGFAYLHGWWFTCVCVCMHVCVRVCMCATAE